MLKRNDRSRATVTIEDQASTRGSILAKISGILVIELEFKTPVE